MAFSRPSAPVSLRTRALRLLARREHSRQELERKLAAHAAAAGEDLAAVLDDLEQRGQISAARVAESLIHRKAARLGAARLAQALRAKGLDEEAVRAAVQPLHASELQRARAVWQRRFGTPPAAPKERAKHLRFLAARGFGAEVAAQVLRGAGAEWDEAEDGY